MRWIFRFFKDFFAPRPKKAIRPRLFDMYFEESNGGGRRRPNRDRA